MADTTGRLRDTRMSSGALLDNQPLNVGYFGTTLTVMFSMAG